jgi:hypothetical protein
MTDSSCYSFNIENVEEEQEGETVTVKKGVLRKYRLPISKLNLKGTRTAPIKLFEEQITLDSDLIDFINSISDTSMKFFLTQPVGTDLKFWNCNGYRPMPEWGNNWTQYLWTVTPSGTLTKQTLVNTSGETLPGIQRAYFDGNYCYFIKAWGHGYGTSAAFEIDSTKIYVLNLTTGAISIINNPAGVSTISGTSLSSNWTPAIPYAGWVLQHGTGDGRIYTLGHTSGDQGFVVDATKGTAYPHNASGANLGTLYKVNNLIRTTGLQMYRDQSYIATINNLAEPVAKDNSKTMKVVYRISFNEEEEESNA